MPRFDCRCGEILRYGEIPSVIEWKIISDAAYERFAGSVDAEDVYAAMESMLRCPECGRLWIFWNGFRAKPEEYVRAGTGEPT